MDWRRSIKGYYQLRKNSNGKIEHIIVTKNCIFCQNAIFDTCRLVLKPKEVGNQIFTRKEQNQFLNIVLFGTYIRSASQPRFYFSPKVCH